MGYWCRNFGRRVRASRRMRTRPSCFETAATPPPEHEEGERAGWLERSKTHHDRASGTSCKARVVAVPCFRPVPSCYRRQVVPTQAAAPARISAFYSAAYGKRENTRLWPAACFFAV